MQIKVVVHQLGWNQEDDGVDQLDGNEEIGRMRSKPGAFELGHESFVQWMRLLSNQELRRGHQVSFFDNFLVDHLCFNEIGDL